MKNNNINIHIHIPVSINENNLFKYNPNDNYYNNICSTFTTDKGTDIVLLNRKKEYNKNYMSLCEKDCNYIEYDSITKRVKCECKNINRRFLSLDDIINKEALLNNFNIKSISNILVMRCYNILFSKEGFFKNIGNYILLTIIIIYIISTIFFYLKVYFPIYNNILNIISKKIKNKDINSIDISNANKINNNSDTNHIDNENIKYYDFEINDFSYKEAIEKDNRTFFQYYISLIKTKYLLFLYFYEDTENNPIKIILFIFSFSLNYTINILFFTDSTMNKIYEDEGIFNFIYLLPKILYSTLISTIIMILVKKLASTNKDLLKLKKNNIIKEYGNKLPQIIKCIKIKIFIFFEICFAFLILFWYFVSCFNAVYKNTQVIIIKDTIISFGLSLSYPFILFLISSIIRICSIKKPEKYMEIFYKLSKVL